MAAASQKTVDNGIECQWEDGENRKRRRTGEIDMQFADDIDEEEESEDLVEYDLHLSDSRHCDGVDSNGVDFTIRDSTEELTYNKHDLERNIEDGKEDLKKAETNSDQDLVNVDNGDDDDGDLCCKVQDETTEDLTIGESFLLKDPFLMEELEAVEGVIKEQVTKSMDLLEEKGYDAFREWRSSAEKRNAKIKNMECQHMEQALKDAKIEGGPRQYQERLFEIACQRNTIIHLGTGTGNY